MPRSTSCSRSTRRRVPIASLAARIRKPAFTIGQHIATVERRVARLATLDASVPHADDAQRLVSQRKLFPAWRDVKARLEAGACAAGLSIDDRACKRRYLPVAVGFRLSQRTGRWGGPRHLPRFRIRRAGRSGEAGRGLLLPAGSAGATSLQLTRFIDRMAQGLGLNSPHRNAAVCCSTRIGSSGPASFSTTSCRLALRGAPCRREPAWATALRGTARQGGSQPCKPWREKPHNRHGSPERIHGLS